MAGSFRSLARRRTAACEPWSLRCSLLSLSLACAFSLGCGGSSEPAGAAAHRDGNPEPRFVDVAREAGLEIVTACGNRDKRHLLESTGGGVAVADYDNDGDEDLYFTTAQTTDDWLAGRRPRANALYRNNGDGTFTDVAREAGVDLRAWSAGAYFADYDNDGDKDLFVTAWGPNVLYRNNGDGTFTDVTRQAGLAGPEDAWSASAAWGDLDGDGFLDLYITNYCAYDLANPPYGGSPTTWHGIEVYRGPVGFEGQADILYRNNGDGTFTDVTRQAGVDDWTRPLYGLGVVMSDFDGDGDLDIYVANDSCPNYLWRNDGGFRFTEVGVAAGVATNEDAKEQAGMGTDSADYDGDGRFDLVVTNFSHDWYTLYRNLGALGFRDETFAAGLKDTYLVLGWGVHFFDYDNDGDLDLFFANGHIYPNVDDHPHLRTSYAQRNQLYRNRGDGAFEEVTERAGPGLAIRESTRGLAVADFDGDGDLDVVLTNLDGKPNLLRNDGGSRRAWLRLRLEGTASNRDAVGAVVEVEAAGRRQRRALNPFGSYQSQSSYVMHFGLGEAERVERLRVRWPSGRVQEAEGLPVRAVVRWREGQAPEVAAP